MENNDLRESFIESYNTKKCYNKYCTKYNCNAIFCNTKSAICFCQLLCYSVLIIVFINIKCGSFSDDISLCDIPDYCPNKNLCNGSDLI
jgi:hypothetical protein